MGVCGCQRVSNGRQYDKSWSHTHSLHNNSDMHTEFHMGGVFALEQRACTAGGTFTCPHELCGHVCPCLLVLSLIR
jgi:hypothetical protein